MSLNFGSLILKVETSVSFSSNRKSRKWETIWKSFFSQARIMAGQLPVKLPFQLVCRSCWGRSHTLLPQKYFYSKSKKTKNYKVYEVCEQPVELGSVLKSQSSISILIFFSLARPSLSHMIQKRILFSAAVFSDSTACLLPDMFSIHYFYQVKKRT